MSEEKQKFKDLGKISSTHTELLEEFIKSAQKDRDINEEMQISFEILKNSLPKKPLKPFHLPLETMSINDLREPEKVYDVLTPFEVDTVETPDNMLTPSQLEKKYKGYVR